MSEKDSTRIVRSKGELTYITCGSPMTIRLETTENGMEEFSLTHTQPIQQLLIQYVVDELRESENQQVHELTVHEQRL